MDCVSVSSLTSPFGPDALIELQFLSWVIIDSDQLPSWKLQHTPSLLSATHPPSQVGFSCLSIYHKRDLDGGTLGRARIDYCHFGPAGISFPRT